MLYQHILAQVNHLISLDADDGSEDAWKELFKVGNINFSDWIRQKLLEEKEARLDKDYIYKKMANLENELSYWKKQLEKAQQMQEAKEQQQEKNVEDENHNILLEKKVRLFMIYGFSEVEAREYAVDYLKQDKFSTIKEYLNSIGVKAMIK